MKNLLIFSFFFNATFCFSQASPSGFVFDKNTNKPIPYAAIRLGNTGLYTITNEDGAFKIREDILIDSIETKHIGYTSKKVAITYFEQEPILFLIPSIDHLDEVTVIAYKNKNHKLSSHQKNYPYEVLRDLIKKYRQKNTVTESKAFFSLNASFDNVPIENIEGFYNSKQSLADGLLDLIVKSGRFGQNAYFPFYSIDNTRVLKDFTLFNKSSTILPEYPGNMSLKSIKRKYVVKMDTCKRCTYEEKTISFIPKKLNGRLFSGKIILDTSDLLIKRIELWINEPRSMKLYAINKHDKITSGAIHFIINFDPVDFTKIQYLDFTVTMNYYHANAKKTPILSHSFLYFYDFHQSFEVPYFTNAVAFNNDYDRIAASQVTHDFWELNYPFPRSSFNIKSMDYFKKNGYVFNPENYIPATAAPYINFALVKWDIQKSLDWASIQETKGALMEKDIPVAQAEIHGERLNFTYLADHYINKNGEKEYTTLTLFNRNTSFYAKPRTKDALDYINLIFDIYEYQRQGLEDKIMDYMTFEEVKRICDTGFLNASVTVRQMQIETDFGSNIVVLSKWKENIRSNLHSKN